MHGSEKERTWNDGEMLKEGEWIESLWFSKWGGKESTEKGLIVWELEDQWPARIHTHILYHIILFIILYYIIIFIK